MHPKEETWSAWRKFFCVWLPLLPMLVLAMWVIEDQTGRYQLRMAIEEVKAGVPRIETREDDALLAFPGLDVENASELQAVASDIVRVVRRSATQSLTEFDHRAGGYIAQIEHGLKVSGSLWPRAGAKPPQEVELWRVDRADRRLAASRDDVERAVFQLMHARGGRAKAEGNHQASLSAAMVCAHLQIQHGNETLASPRGVLEPGLAVSLGLVGTADDCSKWLAFLRRSAQRRGRLLDRYLIAIAENEAIVDGIRADCRQMLCCHRSWLGAAADRCNEIPGVLPRGFYDMNVARLLHKVSETRGRWPERFTIRDSVDLNDYLVTPETGCTWHRVSERKAARLVGAAAVDDVDLVTALRLASIACAIHARVIESGALPVSGADLREVLSSGETVDCDTRGVAYAPDPNGKDYTLKLDAKLWDSAATVP